MRAETKAQMRIWAAGNIEAIGIMKYTLVAVRRRIEQADCVAGRDFRPCKVKVGRRSA